MTDATDTRPDESAGETLARLGTDALAWAQEFARRFAGEQVKVDVGLMLAWFASAIETGRSAGASAGPFPHAAVAADVPACTGAGLDPGPRDAPARLGWSFPADLLTAAWGLIANAGLHRGGWDAEHPEWAQAATRWRDAYHALLDRRPQPATATAGQVTMPVYVQPDLGQPIQIGTLVQPLTAQADAAEQPDPGVFTIAVFPDQPRAVLHIDGIDLLDRSRYVERSDYDGACRTIAEMHEAATGRRGEAPARGVVEDVADVRARMLAAEEALANALAKRGG